MRLRATISRHAFCRLLSHPHVHQSRSCVGCRLMICQVSNTGQTAKSFQIRRDCSVYSGQLSHGYRYQRISSQHPDLVSVNPGSTRPIAKTTQVAASAFKVSALYSRSQCPEADTVAHRNESRRGMSRKRTESSWIVIGHLRRRSTSRRPTKLRRSCSSQHLHNLSRHRRLHQQALKTTLSPVIHLFVPMARSLDISRKTCVHGSGRRHQKSVKSGAGAPATDRSAVVG